MLVKHTSKAMFFISRGMLNLQMEIIFIWKLHAERLKEEVSGNMFVVQLMLCNRMRRFIYMTKQKLLQLVEGRGIGLAVVVPSVEGR